MRVALNLHGFSPGSGGVETYLQGLLVALSHCSDHEVIVLCDRVGERWLNSISAEFNVHTIACDPPGFKWLARGVVMKLSGYDLLRWALRDTAADVIHHPLTVLNPRGLNIPAVLTFHDLQQEYFPGFFSADELRKRRESYGASLEEARVIIAISEHAKKGLIDKYNVSGDKIQVVHHGLSSRFRPTGDEQRLSVTRQKYHIDKPYMIYPASTWAHKNHSRLFAAIRILKDQGRFDGELFLTGAEMDAHEQVVAEVTRLGLGEVVRWMGYLPLDDLPPLYDMARLMIFPSLFEGFGLPILEAMACGCPVACSNTTSIPEVAGDAADYFSPDSVDDIVASIDRMWHDVGRLEDLKVKGQKWAACFSWEKTALQTCKVYEAAHV